MTSIPLGSVRFVRLVGVTFCGCRVEQLTPNGWEFWFNDSEHGARAYLRNYYGRDKEPVMIVEHHRMADGRMWPEGGNPDCPHCVEYPSRMTRV